MSGIKRVHVIYKTHLDIGYTNMGQTVLDSYVQEHIPHAIDLALKINTPEHKKFIWTVGSFLVDYYKRHATPEQLEKMDEAIRLGYFRWHGLAVTSHTELQSPEVLAYNLSVSRKLDRAYGVHTIAAKMTDVPGHTIALVRPLSEAGIRYLHIGVNPSSRVPRVPEVFRWRRDGHEVIVHYSAQYGQAISIPGFDEALEFAHTNDNRGPQDAAQVEAELARIQAKYPGAVVEASTLDAFAASLEKIRDRLPVVEEEIADTWIHGVGSDPYKVCRYKALCTLAHEWLASGRLTEDTPGYANFMCNLMLIAEHTWGMDFKKYLADFKNWTKADFEAARRTDTTTLDLLTNRNASLVGTLEYDLRNYCGGKFSGSYSKFEASHAEQRGYLTAALAELPEALRNEAQAAMDALVPQFDACGEAIAPGVTHTIAGWQVRFGGGGEIAYLAQNGHDWVRDGELGRLQYEVFDAKDTTLAFYRYNRDFAHTGGWAEADFSKPGLETAENLRHTCYAFALERLTQTGDTVIATVRGDGEAAEEYGSPRRAQLIYTFEQDAVHCRLQWFEKDANKIPEALWLHFGFDVENPNRWKMQKLGQLISPLDVVAGGNRKQHAVEKLCYSGADGTVTVESLHAPLVSVGSRNLYNLDDKIESMEDGFYFNLFNNRWGTNFKMWCSDDCLFDFVIRIETNPQI